MKVCRRRLPFLADNDRGVLTNDGESEKGEREDMYNKNDRDGQCNVENPLGVGGVSSPSHQGLGEPRARERRCVEYPGNGANR